MHMHKTLHAFSFLQPHITLTFSFYFSNWKWKQRHTGIWSNIARLQREGSQVLSPSSSIPALPTPAWIPTKGIQVFFSWGSCISTKVFSPFQKLWCLPLPTFSCHGFYRWSYRAVCMTLHYENLLPEARNLFPVLFPCLHISRLFEQRSLYFGTNVIPSMFP